MKTAVTTALYFEKESMRIDYAAIKAHGYDAVDFDLCNTNSPWYTLSDELVAERAAAERQLLLDAGLSICQLHGPWPTDDTTAQSREEKMQHMRRALKVSALLGAPYMVVHPVMPFGWSGEEVPEVAFSMNVDFFRELCGYAEHEGVAVCVENMPFLQQQISRIPRITALVEAVDRDNFFICLDTGHCNVFKDDVGEMVRLCAHKLRVLHVHDNTAKRDDHGLPFSGSIDWHGFVSALREVGFTGVLSIETKVRRDYPAGLREYVLTGLGKLSRALAAECSEES